MANNLYSFECVCYPVNPATEERAAGPAAVGFIQTSGSVETRARRRALEALHNNNIFVKRLVCLDVTPLPKGLQP